MLEPPDRGVDDADIDLPDSLKDVVHAIAVAVRGLNQDFFESALGGGLSDAEYAEIVAVVSRIVDLDVFARGIGVTPRPLPAAVNGEPSRERPAHAIHRSRYELGPGRAACTP